jgi:hypothetical protein
MTSVQDFMYFRTAILWLLNACRRISLVKGLVSGRFVMRMRRGSRVLALSLFHLTTSTNRHIGKTEGRKLRSMSLEKLPMA